jgi:hypothetical protein
MTCVYVYTLTYVCSHRSSKAQTYANTTCREEQLVKDALPAGEVEFDGQAMHVELPEAPTAVEYVPAPQSVQATDPVDDLYFPATHAAHGTPIGPIDPALQVQLVKAALPVGEVELVGQAVHDASAVCPVAVPYLPAQLRHGSVHRHQPLCPAVLHCCPLIHTPALSSITCEGVIW